MTIRRDGDESLPGALWSVFPRDVRGDSDGHGAETGTRYWRLPVANLSEASRSTCSAARSTAQKFLPRLQARCRCRSRATPREPLLLVRYVVASRVRALPAARPRPRRDERVNFTSAASCAFPTDAAAISGGRRPLSCSRRWPLEAAVSTAFESRSPRRWCSLGPGRAPAATRLQSASGRRGPRSIVAWRRFSGDCELRRHGARAQRSPALTGRSASSSESWSPDRSVRRFACTAISSTAVVDAATGGRSGARMGCEFVGSAQRWRALTTRLAIRDEAEAMRRRRHRRFDAIVRVLGVRARSARAGEVGRQPAQRKRWVRPWGFQLRGAQVRDGPARSVHRAHEPASSSRRVLGSQS